MSEYNSDTFFSDDVRHDPPKAASRPRDWIGVDFDGTLSHKVSWADTAAGKVGAPIWPMVYRVQEWLADDREVKIFTARVWPGEGQENADKQRRVIEQFCLDNFGRKLEVTHEKDFYLVEFWDDRAIQVEVNTGEPTTFWNSNFA